MTKCEDAMSEVTPEDLAFRLRSNLLSDGAFIRIEAAEALERLTAELAEVRARVKVLSSLGSGPHPQLRALDEALARATAAEASAREAWKKGMLEAAGIAEGWKSSLRPGTDARLLGHQEAAREISQAIRAKVGV